MLPTLQNTWKHGWNSTADQSYTPKGKTEKNIIIPQITSGRPVQRDSKGGTKAPNFSPNAQKHQKIKEIQNNPKILRDIFVFKVLKKKME